MIPRTRSRLHYNPKWAEFFNNIGQKQNWLTEAPSLGADGAKRQFLFRAALNKVLRRAEADLGITYSTIQNIMKKLVRMFPETIKRGNTLQP